MRNYVLCVLVLVFVGNAYAAEYFVSVQGDDSNPGTLAAPFLTIQRAADVMKAGDTCIVREGVYREMIRPANSGSEGAPIRFQAFEDEQVLVSGADPVTGWALDEGTIWKAKLDWDLGKNNQLFLDGEMLDEARWPNRTSGDLLIADAAPITSAEPGHIVCDTLPDDIPDDAWKDAVLWVIAHNKWHAWTATVTGYVAAEKKLLFDAASTRGAMKHHNPKYDGEFYIAGVKCALDAPGEWYFDVNTSTMFLRAPEDADPNQHRVTAKRRMLAFDLSKRSYVQVKGINVHAATMDLNGADHCLVQGIRATYISHSRGGKTHSRLATRSGIPVSGHHNVIRDSEIAFSAGNGITVGGSDNAVVNCFIHDIDYMGHLECAINVSGLRHLISHNTIRRSGRDNIQPRGAEVLVQYNDFSESGMLTHDVGMIYISGTDSGGTEIHHNWFHDSKSTGYGLGLYLDGYTHNFIMHHNVMWNCRDNEMRLNLPSSYNVVANNTIIGKFTLCGGSEIDRMVGDVVVNNIITSIPDLHYDYVMWDNLQYYAGIPIGKFHTCRAAEIGKDKGTVIPGITDGYKGEAPDIGAYEYGEEPWKPGHDFENPPQPVYKLTPTPLTNRVRNACFQHGHHDGPNEKGDRLNPWRKTHAKRAAVVSDGGFLQHYNKRRSMYGGSVHLQGDTDDGVEQAVSRLEPGKTYQFTAFVKVDGADEVRIGVKDFGGADVHVSSTDTLWKSLSVRFTTGPENTSATVYILKKGGGKAYADDTGCGPALIPEL